MVFPIKDGQEIIMAPGGNNCRYFDGPQWGKVVSIKRKYFFVKRSNSTYRFERATFAYNDPPYDGDGYWVLYPDVDTCKREELAKVQLGQIKSYFARSRFAPSSETIFAIHDLLVKEGVLKEDN